MKAGKKLRKVCFVLLLFISIISLSCCGKKENESGKEDVGSVKKDSEDMFGVTDKSDEAGDYEDMKTFEDDTDSEDESNSGLDEDSESWRGDIFKFELEGDNASELNGRILSIIFSDDTKVFASTTDGSLFMLRPSIYYSKEDSEIESYKITDDSGISDFIFANQHIAYGKNHFVFFDMTEEFDEMDELDESDSFSIPEIVYIFENMQKETLSDDQNLIIMADEAKCYVYEDTDNHVRAAYKDSPDKEYTFFSDVVFEGETERNDVAADKCIYQFVLTDDKELLYVKNINISSDFGGEVNGVSVSYIDITERIGAKVKDIYNLQNDTDCCYAVDEENNIYYVSTTDTRDITADKITQFELGTPADIQGFSGMNEKMLIKTDEGTYYYYDGDSYIPTREIDVLDKTYKKAVLLLEGNILALGNDGYLYVIENKN